MKKREAIEVHNTYRKWIYLQYEDWLNSIKDFHPSEIQTVGWMKLEACQPTTCVPVKT